MVLMKIFNPILSLTLVIALQKLVSQIVLLNKSVQNDRDIFYDDMVLIFLMKTIEKSHVKRLIERMTKTRIIRKNTIFFVIFCDAIMDYGFFLLVLMR